MVRGLVGGSVAAGSAHSTHSLGRMVMHDREARERPDLPQRACCGAAITRVIGRGYWPPLLSHQVIDEQWPDLAVTTYSRVSR